jgi:uncharacterized membrane protein
VKGREVVDAIRHSLWFVPAVWTVLAGVAALVLIWLSGEIDPNGEGLPLVFSAGADGARAMLQAIAGSIITVAGVIFSVTIIALQLTSTQFSPRVLRNFMSDRGNQMVLGAFVGTFTYTLLVLRSIKAENGGDEFVPAFAVTGALLLTLLSVAMLIYFIHHISSRIQVTSILASVAEETLEALAAQSEWWDADDGERSWRPTRTGVPVAVPPSGAIPSSYVGEDEQVLDARQSGYLQLLDIAALVTAAQAADGRVRLLVAPGSWVQKDAPLAAFRPPADRETELEALGRQLADSLSLSRERSLQQDVAYGIQQLTDVAAKALSPGVNDPTTAVNAIDRLVEVLVAVGRATDPPRAFESGDGVVRLEVPFPDFDELVGLAFDGIRHYAAGTPSVVIHLARGLSILRSLPVARHAPLRRQARLLADAASGIELEGDRRRALEAVAPLLD